MRKGFEEFLNELATHISDNWVANDGGLTMAASDELAAINWWRAQNINSPQDALRILEEIDDPSWVDLMVDRWVGGA